MANDSNGRRPFRSRSNGQWWTFETSDVTWSQKSTIVYTLDPELMHTSIVTDVLDVQIYSEFPFIVTIYDIFKLIIDYQVDHQI